MGKKYLRSRSAIKISSSFIRSNRYFDAATASKSDGASLSLIQLCVEGFAGQKDSW